MGSQGEAKCYTKEFNGSQEAKGLWWLNNILTKTRLSDVNPPIEVNRLQERMFHSLQFEANTLSDNISLNFIDTFHALAFHFQAFGF